MGAQPELKLSLDKVHPEHATGNAVNGDTASQLKPPTAFTDHALTRRTTSTNIKIPWFRFLSGG